MTYFNNLKKLDIYFEIKVYNMYIIIYIYYFTSTNRLLK